MRRPNAQFGDQRFYGVVGVGDEDFDGPVAAIARPAAVRGRIDVRGLARAEAEAA